MDGHTIGVFGTDKEQKARFMASVAKKSEVEGMIVYHRNEAGKRYSLLDDPQYPDRIQGYSRIASICDYAYYLLPKGGRLTPPDGELAVLLESYGLPGTRRDNRRRGSPGDRRRPRSRVSGWPTTRRREGRRLVDNRPLRDRSLTELPSLWAPWSTSTAPSA